MPASGEQLVLHDLLKDHAVLQRDRPLEISGRALARDEITVAFAGHSTSTTADGTGRWSLQLPAMPAGGPFTLEVKAKSGEAKTVQDVLVGDVWLCSGQSNMVLQVHRALDARAEIAGAANDTIRMVTVGLATSLTPRDTFASPVTWLPATSSHVAEFSAACYYFARELQKTVRVPMGLITSAWGGSRIEAWMSDGALKAVGGYDEPLATLRTFASDPHAAGQQWGTTWEEWWRARVKPAKSTEDAHSTRGAAQGSRKNDARAPGKSATHEGVNPPRGRGARVVAASYEPWRDSSSHHSGWSRAPAALGAWETWGVPELQSYNGLLWYRTTVKLDSRQAKQGAVLSLGPIDEVDETWVNGRHAGSGSGPGKDRLYTLPAGMLRAGINTIVVCALDTYGSGGITGPAEKRALKLADGTVLPLSSAWEYQLVPEGLGPAPRAPWEDVAGLTTIRNAMIAPLGRYGLRGALWYQGESNTEQPRSYQKLLAGLMADWRAQFGADLPFLIVQLANYGPAPTAPAESGWAEVRDAQRLAVANDPHAGLAIAIDIGDRYDIHPSNKQEVGRRLARAARKVIYKESIAPSGPIPASARRTTQGIVIEFSDVEKRLITYSANSPIGFELCGETPASCRYASATIQGSQVTLAASPEEQTSVTRVRYCWADSPVCTLFDRANLPAGPFEITLRQGTAPQIRLPGHASGERDAYPDPFHRRTGRARGRGSLRRDL